MNRNEPTPIVRLEELDSTERPTVVLAHDLNNLLCAIRGLVQLHLESHVETSAQCEDLVEVIRSVDRATELLGRLHGSRGSQSRQQPTDLAEMVRDMLALVQQVTGEHVAVQLVADEVPPVRLDRLQFEVALVNLAANARDAMGGDGTLTIAVRSAEVDHSYGSGHANEPAGPHVRVSVSDTGTGMDETTMARMFEPLFTTKSAGKGRGLGLVSVSAVVEGTGGHIEVESAVGRGTRVSLCIPAIAGALPPPSPSSADGQVTAG